MSEPTTPTWPCIFPAGMGRSTKMMPLTYRIGFIDEHHMKFYDYTWHKYREFFDTYRKCSMEEIENVFIRRVRSQSN